MRIMMAHKINNPLTLVVFGATGDLYQNKLSLALFNLFCEGLLPKDFTIIGFARRSLADLDFQNFTRDAILNKSKNISQKNLEIFLKHIKYIQGDLEDVADFRNLSKQLASSDEKEGSCSNKLFYLAVPPSLYGVIFQNISHAGLTIPCSGEVVNKDALWTRVLVEKPFGKDMKDAKHLDKMLGELFDESQVFRIDHYLAKETMQDLLTFRFGGRNSKSLWNHKNIEYVRITFLEDGVVGSRGGFYDGIGALRDVGQNHMLQMLTVVAMEKPKILNAKNIHRARETVLQKTSLFTPKSAIVRGQYQGYLQEPKVKLDSNTETFFHLDLEVNNKRWKGVRFELESGKALSKREISIEVCFKGMNKCLTFPIFSKKSLHDAYEKVFYDCILGDQVIFTSTKEIMAQFRLFTNIIKRWQKIPLLIYPQGSRAEDIK